MNAEEQKRYEDLRCLAESRGVPMHLCHGLALYVTKGIKPGGFLTSVLENNLTESFARGDENSLSGLRTLVTFLYNEVPGICWGSMDRVTKWMNGGYNANR